MISVQTLKRIGIWVGAAVAALLVLVLVSQVTTRACSSVPDSPIRTRIDGGGAEADRIQREIEAEARAAERIREIEAEHREELQRFDTEQREDYERVRRQGPDAVADWLSEFNEDLRRDKH